MTGKELVQQYLRSRTQSAWTKVGKIDVNIEGGMTRRPEPPRVRVNWPGIGAQAPEDALQFAADLTAACLLAVQAEAILVGWGDCDQWFPPELRTEQYEAGVEDI